MGLGPSRDDGDDGTRSPPSFLVQAIHEFATFGDVEKGVELLQHANLIEAKDGKGKTPLLTACSSLFADRGSLKRAKFVRMLVESGADVNFRGKNRGWTALHYCCSIGAMDAAEVLLEHGASPTVRDDMGLLPIHVLSLPLSGRTALLGQLGGDENVQGPLNAPHSLDWNREQFCLLPPQLLDSFTELLEKYTEDFEAEQDLIRVEQEIIAPNETVEIRFDRSKCKFGDFIQLFYVDNRPWNMFPRLGSFRVVNPSRSNFVIFPSDYLPEGSYRALLVEEESEKIIGASEIFHVAEKSSPLWGIVKVRKTTSSMKKINMQQSSASSVDDGSVTTQHPEEEKDGADWNDDEEISNHPRVDTFKAETSEKSSQVLQMETFVERDTIEHDYTSADSDSESDEGDERRHEYPSAESSQTRKNILIPAAPWEMPPLPCKDQTRKRDKMVRQRVKQVTKEQTIWKSKWTKLEHPPPDSFEFDLARATPHARVALEEDEELREARFRFVPAKISEYSFWWIYFWTVEKIKLQVTDEIQCLLDDAELPPDSPTGKHSKSMDEILNGCNVVKVYDTSSLPIQARVAVLRDHVRSKLEKANKIGGDADEADAIGSQTSSTSSSSTYSPNATSGSRSEHQRQSGNGRVDAVRHLDKDENHHLMDLDDQSDPVLGSSTSTHRIVRFASNA